MSEEDDDVGDSESVLVPVESSELMNIHEAPEVPGRTFTLDEMHALGMPTPVADPDTLRAAYAFQRKVVVSILDREHDFLYTISYQEQGKQREKLTTSYTEVLKYVKAYGAPYKASPKKSGIAKLATAFDIEGRVVRQLGLPIDPAANYAYVEYEVTLRKTGKKAMGVGWARANERGYPMPEHHMIALADTRAWGRAVLRICGFGEVGAEEIGGDIMPVTNVLIKMAAQRPVAALPAAVSAEVINVASAPDETRVPVSAQRAAPVAASAVPTTTPAPARPAASAPAAVPSSVPMPTPGATTPTITEAQVGKLSSTLKAKLGSTDKAREWLKKETGLDTTRAVREQDYAGLMTKLDAMEVP